MTDRTQPAPIDHPLPWSEVRSKSGIALKDADGATVLLIPFTGVSSRPRKLTTAGMILKAVNGPPRRG